MILIGVLLVLIGLTSFVGLVFFGKFLGFLFIYPFFLKQIVVLGVDIYLAKAFAILLTFGFWFVLFKYFLRVSSRKRNIGFAFLIAFFVIHAFISYLINRDRPVSIDGDRGFCTIDQITGNVLQFNQAIFDSTGQKAEPCTDEELRQLVLQKNFPSGEIPLEKIGSWFDRNGKPLLYYYQDSKGKFHFRYTPGFTKTGQKWQPVTKEVLEKNQKQLEEQITEENKDTMGVKEFEKNQWKMDESKWCMLFTIACVLMIIVLWYLVLTSSKFDTTFTYLFLSIPLLALGVFNGLYYFQTPTWLTVTVISLLTVGPIAIIFLAGVLAAMFETPK